MEPVKLDGEEICLHDVSFSYKENGDNAISHINLSIKPGTVTALVGPSGSGKSTITKLIAGFWDVGSGSITLDGKDLRKIPQKQLADQIAPQFYRIYFCKALVNSAIRCSASSRREIPFMLSM